jgi:hypothetical protein
VVKDDQGVALRSPLTAISDKGMTLLITGTAWMALCGFVGTTLNMDLGAQLGISAALCVLIASELMV